MKPGTKLTAAGAVALVMASGVHGGHHNWSFNLPVLTAAGASPDVSANVALGRRLAARYYGWTGAQWNCLYALWNQESGWSNTALNPKSGADGIAQALGHGPTGQYPAGPANPPTNDPRDQELWGLRYIRSTYGTPCGAEAHEQADGWY